MADDNLHVHVLSLSSNRSVRYTEIDYAWVSSITTTFNIIRTCTLEIGNTIICLSAMFTCCGSIIAINCLGTPLNLECGTSAITVRYTVLNNVKCAHHKLIFYLLFI